MILNVHAPRGDKTDDVKNSFYEEFQCVFDKFPKYHLKILLDFNANVGREDIFKLTIGNESFHEISKLEKSSESKSTMFPHRNIHKYTWTSPDGKTHNQIDHILVDRRRYSNVLDFGSFGAADVIVTVICWWQKLGRD
jgi:hypothetical protein